MKSKSFREQSAPVRSANVPVSFFGIAVGSLAWGQAWLSAVQLWPLHDSLATVAVGFGLALWLTILLFYIHKWLARSDSAREELNHPVQSAAAALGPVSTLLAAMSLQALWPEPAWLLYVVGTSAQLLLGLWLMGRFWQGGRSPDSINAGVYLPSVAQNFVAATASAAFGYPTAAALFFGAGFFSWLAFDSMVLSRAATHAPMDPAQRPLQGIQLAPAVVGGLSYLSLTSGPPDLMAHMLLGYGLYQALLAARQWHWTRHAPFSPSYWAFSFGVMALATMAMRLLQRAPNELLWQLLAPALFVAANAVMAWLLWHTSKLAVQRRLIPRPFPVDSSQLSE
jgi:tellurite resistance protein